MQYELSTQGTEAVLALRERFTAVDAPEFRSIIHSIGELAVRTVVIDLERLDFIDSAAMGLLVLVRDSAMSRAITMRVRAPQGQVKKAFAIFNFSKLFDVEP
ncbi:MAG TPA: STAS domain-containing protein [Patescibacteria group bacterium]|nr:STAS domain-containing protein [Patescibacteria group bacterium]